MEMIQIAYKFIQDISGYMSSRRFWGQEQRTDIGGIQGPVSI